MRTTTRFLRPALPALLALSLVACGRGDDGGDDDAIATLGGEAAGDSASEDGGGGPPVPDAEFQDAMLEYAQCMRDEGVDFPDPELDGDGLVVVGPGGPGEEPPSQAEMEDFEAADAGCRSILEDVQGSMPQPSPEEEQEMRDNALAFAECMREQGVDFPDPQFGEGGQISQHLGEGVDFDDPDFQAAQEICMEEQGDGPLVGAAPTPGNDEVDG